MAVAAAQTHAVGRSLLRRAIQTLWRLVVATVATCLRNRVTGLAAEAAFFALLSLPPLLFGLTGSIGYVFSGFDAAQEDQVRRSILDMASRALTDQTVATIVSPTLDDVFRGGRFDVISVGFILALWSGSRALNVFIDTITIMYGLGDERGIVRTRVLSFSLYVMGLFTGVVAVPLVVAGPQVVDGLLPSRLDFLNALYWPVVVALCVCFLATLYHVSVPVRTSWRYNLPGAVLTMAFWLVGSLLLRWVLTHTARGSTSIYGPLAAPIIVMIWLYVLSIAVLIGAALNSAFDRIWPEKATARARQEIVGSLRRRVAAEAAPEGAVPCQRADRPSGDQPRRGESPRDREVPVLGAGAEAAAGPGDHRLHGAGGLPRP